MRLEQVAGGTGGPSDAHSGRLGIPGSGLPITQNHRRLDQQGQGPAVGWLGDDGPLQQGNGPGVIPLAQRHLRVPDQRPCREPLGRLGNRQGPRGQGLGGFPRAAGRRQAEAREDDGSPGRHDESASE